MRDASNGSVAGMHLKYRHVRQVRVAAGDAAVLVRATA
jgi:hypothetical protein